MTDMQVEGPAKFEVTSNPMVGLVVIDFLVVDGSANARIVIGLTGPEADNLCEQIAAKRAEVKP